MPNRRILPCLIVMVCLLGGCETATTPQQGRIDELKTQYERLTPAVQAEVAKGAIAESYSFEMVYMALGRPDDIETMADGRSVQWTYRNFYPSARVLNTSLYGNHPIDPLQKASNRWMNSSRRDIQDDVNNGVEIRSAPKTSVDVPDTSAPIPGVTLDVIFTERQVVEYLINEQKS